MKKSWLGTILLVGLCVFGLGSEAAATTFTFNYSLADGQTLSGTINGTLSADNNTVVNFTSLNAVYSGLPGVIFDNPAPAVYGNSLKLDGSSAFTIEGFVDPVTTTPTSNLGFFINTVNNTNAIVVGPFTTAVSQIVFPQLADRLESEAYVRSRFSAAAVPTAVPEPTTLTLLALPLLHVFVRKRTRR